MTAATSAVDARRKEGERHTYPVKESTTIPAGVMVCVGSDGYAVNGADTSGLVFVGVAMETVENSGASGAAEIEVYRTGMFELAVTGTAPAIGAPAYIADNVTVASGLTATNDIKCGVVGAAGASGKVWVDIRVEQASAYDLVRVDSQTFLYPVKASTTITSGTIVAVATADGYAVPGADTAGLVAVGVAAKTVVNAGVSGAVDVQVYRTGLFEFAVTGTAPVIGASAMISDASTVAAAATTTNDIKAGVVVGDGAAGKLWVDIGR